MAKLNLTDKGIKSLPIGDKIAEYYDEGFQGGGSLILTISPGGTKSFYVAYRAGKQKRKMKLGTYPSLTLKKARSEARKKVSQAALGEDPWLQKKIKDSADTFNQLADLYLEKHARVKKSPSSAKQDEQRLTTYIRPRWGTRNIHDIKKRDVLELLDYLLHENKTPILANRIQALVSKIFNFAVERDLLEMSPAYKIPRPALERPRDRVLSDEEIQKLWKVLDEESFFMACIFRLLLLTGQREGQISAMRWSQMADDVWIIPRELTKHKKSEHQLPLSKNAMAILKDLKAVAGSSDFVFYSRSETGHVAWFSAASKRITDACGFDFTPHDLRRTARTKWAEMGIPNDLCTRIQDHISEMGRMTRTYDHYDRLPEMRQALERWGARLEQIVTGKVVKVVRMQ